MAHFVRRSNRSTAALRQAAQGGEPSRTKLRSKAPTNIRLSSRTNVRDLRFLTAFEMTRERDIRRLVYCEQPPSAEDEGEGTQSKP